jgi:SAM-dependent methyltransferase
MTKTDNNYQKYYIVNGQHIGDYENMYQNCTDPWHIEELGLRLDMKAALLLLEELTFTPEAALDAGAGTGLFTEQVAHNLWHKNPSCHLTVADISPTALSLAANRLSGQTSLNRPNQAQVPQPGSRIDYVAFDLRWLNSTVSPWMENSFDFIVLAQVLWGLLENLSNSLSGLTRIIRPNGYLLISQHFHAPEIQTYGTDIVGSPEDYSKFLSQAGFRLLNTLETNRGTNHHWASLWQWN